MRDTVKTAANGKSNTFRFITFITALIFCFEQFSFAGIQELAGPHSQNPIQNTIVIPEVDVSPKNDITVPSIGTPSSQLNSTEFLSRTLTLESTVAERHKEHVSQVPDLNYEYERYDFETAVDLLREDYAAAVIVNDLNLADLEKMTRLSIETGIAVLHGEIVLFTSGNQDEIRVLAPVQELLKKASFVSHTHVENLAAQGPSGSDLNGAGSQEEYVITADGVYVYNHDGLLNNGLQISWDQYLARLQEAVSSGSLDRDQLGTRRDLHNFIRDQDLYNQASLEMRETFRRGGTFSFDAGLDVSLVTVFSGNPLPYIAEGSGAGTHLSFNETTNQYQLRYNVPAAEDASGFSVSFDDANTSALETQDLSAVPTLIFGLKGKNTSATLEVVDADGNKDTMVLTQISNTKEQFWSIPTSTLSHVVDKTKIRALNFWVSQADTTEATRTGNFFIRVLGLCNNAPEKPAVTSNPPALTKQRTLVISGTKEANTAILINGVVAVARDSATTWSATIRLNAEGDNEFSVSAKNSIGLVSAPEMLVIQRDTVIPTGAFVMNGGASVTASSTVSLELSASDEGSGVAMVSFSTDRSTWTAPEAYTTTRKFVLPDGDGRKTLYVRYYDAAGNASAVCPGSIVLDTQPPSGRIKINGGAPYANQASVILNLSASDAGSGVDQMSFSEDGVHWTEPETFAATKTWNLAGTDGRKKVYVKFSDKSGKWSEFISDSIRLDTTAPEGSIAINSGALFTKNSTVTLDLSASDGGSGINTMSFSTDGVNWSVPEAFAATRDFNLPSGGGEKSLFARYFDNAGNVSAVYSTQIILDTVPPVLAVSPETPLLINTRNLTIRYTSDGVEKVKSFKGLAEGENLLTVVETNLAGNQAIAHWTVTVDTTAPVVVIDAATPTLINGRSLTVSYMSDGINKTKLFSGLVEGQNSLAIIETDLAGNQTTAHWAVTVDTIPPEIIFNSPSVTHDGAFLLSYTVDGVEHSEARQLSFWENRLNVSVSDAAGNMVQAACEVNYLPPVLPDGTQLFYDNDKLRQEITPSGNRIFYDERGRTERYRLADGREIRYEETADEAISIYGQDGTLIKRIDQSSFLKDETTDYLAVTYPDGAKAYFDDGHLKQVDTVSGIRVSSIVLDDSQKIREAVLSYPDGTQEIFWDGYLLRRFGADGGILDLVPTGFAVREIIQNGPQYFSFEKNSQTEVFRTKISAATGSSIYDEFGILREAQDAAGNRYIFERVADGNFWRTVLDRKQSGPVPPQSMVAGKYARDGSLLWLKLENGTEIFFEAGQVARAVDAAGKAVEYSSLSGDGTLGGLQVTRAGTQFNYDPAGFLNRIVTGQGTITRTAQDTNDDGRITNQDAVRLILDTVSGYRLTDFAFDSRGNILKGILTLQDGIKQYIQNGVVTGFETSDGRTYQYQNQEAVLKEWRLPGGAVAQFLNGEISQILFPDGRRLHTIGFDQNMKIETVIEELADGTQKFFQDGNLIKLVTSNHTEIHYDAQGLARRIILPDSQENTIHYGHDASGGIQNITVEGPQSSYTFTPDGQLVSLLTGGVSARIEEDVLVSLSTRFGRVENPNFNDAGLLSGTVNLTDGTKLVVENGEWIQAVRPTGTKVNYRNGQIVSIETREMTYELEYDYRNHSSQLLRFFYNNPTALTSTFLDDEHDWFDGPSFYTLSGNGNYQGGLRSDAGGFSLGNGEFTIEARVKPEPGDGISFARGGVILGQETDGGTGKGWVLQTSSRGDKLEFWVGGKQVISGVHGMNVDQGYHVTVIRGWGGDPSQWALTVDGKVIAISKNSDVTLDSDGSFCVSRCNVAPIGSDAWMGWIDEVRVSDVARWTSEFTPSNHAYESDSNTKLLYHFDSLYGTIGGDFTDLDQIIFHYKKGDAEGETPLVSYLQAHPDPEVEAILFSRPLYDTLENFGEIQGVLRPYANHLIKPQGGTFLDTSHAALGEGSLRLNGNGDFLKIEPNRSVPRPSEDKDFSIDFKINFQDFQDVTILDSERPSSPSAQYPSVVLSFQSGMLRLRVIDTARGPDRYYDFPLNEIVENQDCHFAITRKDGVLRAFQNGRQIGMASPSTDRIGIGISGYMSLGADWTGGQSLRGWIDEFRISNSARWSSDFEVPQEEYSRDANTWLLLHFSQMEFDKGREQLEREFQVRPADNVSFGNFVSDDERGTAFEFNHEYSPEWGNVSKALGGGYISEKRVLDGYESLISDLIDMNGDGLVDRVYLDESYGKWWVQWNQLGSFSDSTAWMGAAGPEGNHQAYWNAMRHSQGAYGNVYSDLLDMTGDGLPDRIMVLHDGSSKWYIQKNNGHGFDPVKIWADNVQLASQSDLSAGFALRARDSQGGELIADLVDLDGDGLPDRVVRPKLEAPEAIDHWFFQRNTGNGFEDAVLWSGVDPRLNTDQELGGALAYYDISGNDQTAKSTLADINHDGLPDRFGWRLVSSNPVPSYEGFAQLNNGKGFDPAFVIPLGNWPSQYKRVDLKTFRNWDYPYVNNWETLRKDFVAKGILNTDGQHEFFRIVDMNADGRPDRIMFSEAQGTWLIQYGKKENSFQGFNDDANAATSLQNYILEAVSSSSEKIKTSRYDFLHISLKAFSDLPASMGSLHVAMGNPSNSLTYQEWTLDSLTAEWKDFFLPLNPDKQNSNSVKVWFEPAGFDPEVPIYVDNITFVATRTPASKGWLDYLLAGENILSAINSERRKTLAQSLGLAVTDASLSLNWEQLLQAETRIHFDTAGKADRFQTLYGSVSDVENGHVTRTMLSNGTRVEFAAPDPANSQTTTQQVTHYDGTTETLDLAYGRVRRVSRPDASSLDYAYEFDDAGHEITVVHDPDSGVTERYQEVAINGHSVSQLISRIQTNGVQTVFEYDGKGNLIRSSLLYQGRVRGTFEHGTNPEGHQLITTEAGVREEYAADGTLLFHTTADGYRYAHTYEQAKQVVVTYQTVTKTLPDGTTVTVQIPQVQLQADPEGERIHVVTLSSYLDANQNTAEYGTDMPSGAQTLKAMKLAEGTNLIFDRIQAKDIIDPQTRETRSEVFLLDATVFHADGTVTEYRDGKPFRVVSASGKEISLLTESGPNGEEYLLDSSEAAAFHWRQAKALWSSLVLSKWSQYKLPATIPVKSEYAISGELRVCRYADGTTELYSDRGKIEQVLSPEGERMILYHYDAEGELIDMDMEGSRRRLESAILHLRAEVSVEREKALAAVADRQKVLSQTLEGAYIVQRDQLLALRSQIEVERERLGSTEIKGKKGKGMMADAMSQIQTGIDQVNAALDRLAEQRQAALQQLANQVRDAKLQIETESQKAYDAITLKAGEVRHSILEQEIMPVVYHWYRKILGRDPNKNEYDSVVAGADDVTGTFNLEALKDRLLTGQEFIERTAEVRVIKNSVENELQRFLTLSEEMRLAYAADLGIASSELISISADDVQKMSQWLEKQPIHFGQSAFLALEALIKQQTTDYSSRTQRIESASQLILIDILTGTLTPLEQSDLVISAYAMRRVAKKYGVDVTPYAMSYDALVSLYSVIPAQAGIRGDGSPINTLGDDSGLRLIAHINGNHYVIITNVTDTEVTYTDPGAGPDNALESVTLSKEDFLKIWLAGTGSSVAGGVPAPGFGYVLSARPPPLPLELQVPGGNALEPLGSRAGYRILSTSEQMSVRGAFFPFLVFVAAAIITAIQAVVVAVVTVITAIVGALVAGVGSVIGGFGVLVSGIFSGNFLAGVAGLFQGVLAGIGQMATGIFGAIVQLGQGLLGVFTGLSGSLVGAISQGLGHSGFFGSVLPGFFQSNFFAGVLHAGFLGLELQGAGTLMDALGVSPKISKMILHGGQLALGIGMLASGNPLGISFLAGGTSELLSPHANLSSTFSGMIGISAAAVGSFAAGGFNGGTLAGAIRGLQSAMPFLSMDLASAGLASLGSVLGGSPYLSGLINIPLRAAVGAGISSWANGLGKIQIGVSGQGLPLYASDVRNFFEYVTGSVFSPAALSGMLSAGVNFGLGQLGLPSMASGLISGFISGLGQTAGGQDLFSKIKEGLTRFKNGASRCVGTVVDFGTRALNGTAEMTVAGFKNAVSAFASIFSPETREGIYSDVTNVRNATVTTQGDIWTWRSGDTRIDYNVATGRVKESFGGNGTVSIEGLGQDASGQFAYRKLNYETVTADGILTQVYEDGAFSEWRFFGTDGTALLSRADGPNGWDASGNVVHGDIEIHAPSITIGGLDPDDSTRTYVPYAWVFRIANGRVTNSRYTYSLSMQDGSGAGPDSTSLYVLANGVGNPSFTGAPDYINHLKRDLHNRSANQIALSRIIPTPLYFPWINGGTIDTAKDIVTWVAESQGISAALAAVIDAEIRQSLGVPVGQAVTQAIIGVGFSGGFEPLVETLNQFGYHPVSLIALAGIIGNLAAVGTEILNLILDVAGKIENGTVQGLRGFLDKLFSKIPIVGDAVQLATSIVDCVNRHSIGLAFDALRGALAGFLQALPPALPAQIHPSANLMVNLFGTDDILYKLNLIGPRNDVSGFTPTGQVDSDGKSTKKLFNIQIEGANHSEYMSRDADRVPRSSEWNKTVSDFVTDLIINSGTPERLTQFLEQKAWKRIAFFEDGIWIIRLPGWDQPKVQS